MSDAVLVLREYAKLAPWNIRDLAKISGGILDASGVTPISATAQSHPSDRTIRFYVARSLMSEPDGRGTAATYGYRHLLQLLAIKLRQMEGVTLKAIAKELSESPGDVLEKRVAAALGAIPTVDQLGLSPAASRGRVARALARKRPEGTEATGHGGTETAGTEAPAHGSTVQEAVARGAWYRVSAGNGIEVSVRHDHPAAGTTESRQRLVEAVARAIRELFSEDEP
jgi:DNA-binding transcriptional MerR regulator